MSNRPYLSTARGQTLSNPPLIPTSPVRGGGGGGGGVPDVTDKCIIHIYIILTYSTLQDWSSRESDIHVKQAVYYYTGSICRVSVLLCMLCSERNRFILMDSSAFTACFTRLTYLGPIPKRSCNWKTLYMQKSRGHFAFYFKLNFIYP